ncbi:MAG TPA: tetratricopeptide repeat protein [Chitinophagaceae bacterium]|nr:tetratricopeptide repeat protein [Chitinophagaceae bacterium]
MRFNRNTITAIIFLILFRAGLPGFGQMGISFDIKKPKEYDERVLRSERSDQKKFTLPRRFIQNTVTHYNYFFNANNKLNEVLTKAKEAFKDDYSQLLPFYNYTLDATATDSIQLDSITYKASTGIALHDLRNDWVDNLYLLWGAAFYLQKKFDSAYLMFQFMNYAFAPKEKDGYYLTIGSARDGNNAYSISTKEKRSLPKRLLSQPPSRNDAFIWQIRNYLAQDQFAEAASLIVTLRNDPNFPSRLQNDLHEVQAYWFYKQNMWDSAANHLVKALSNAGNLQEKARWEYLAAQLFELSGKYKEAETYYNKVTGHTTDPILDIYARLANIRVNRDGGEKTIEKNVEALVKMAKQDKFEDYRDIIYYMAAQMQLQGNNIEEAMALLLKSTQFFSNSNELRNKAFLQLAELSFAQKKYRQAYNFYDSIQLSDPKLKDPDAIKSRKESLGIIAANYEIIERQDSLQRIAAMPENERAEFVKKLVKQLRKAQGLKDDKTSTGGSGLPPVIAPTLFPSANEKGEWYFYNAASRTRGQNDFKTKWGNRPNTDNWRRSAVMTAIIAANQTGNNPVTGASGNQQQGPAEISYEALYDQLPLTPEKLKISNDSIQNALFELGKAYIQQIEDCNSGTETLEQLRSRFPEFKKMDEVLFNLYYCYKKNGQSGKAEDIKNLLTQNMGQSEYAKILATGENPKSNLPGNTATKLYESIYDLFIEGKFGEAVTKKKTADSIYGRNYWTPQLLYIEAVYYIKQRKDSIAKEVLTSLIGQFGTTPIGIKAANLLAVLNRRAQIEEELKNLVINRAPADTGKTKPPVTVITAPVVKKDSVVTQPVVKIPPTVKKDSVITQPVTQPDQPFVHAPAEPHYVVLVLNKVDPVFANETRNAFSRYNRDNFNNKNFSIDLFELDPENRLLLIAPFTNAADAISYIDKTKPRTADEIIPWLKGGKYYFSILTNGNFDLLKQNKNLEGYKSFLNQYFPGKF